MKLGDLARDTVTGFEGVIICKAEWLNGCIRYTLQPRKLSKDGGVKQAESFDHEQVELVESKVVTPLKPSGGPMPDPVRR